ncbi:hypothetical protein OG196_06245 [Kitasatospora purpeofusca]|uniref:hypothetical protein n=1 Tax=Kitasatospora purpeofusca TaxID=67352 RepID=UPI002E168812|nr:hypothetical protein OG196_06245 [Kitasatospora purpeofusca]
MSAGSGRAVGRVLASVLLGTVVALLCALLAPTAWAQASMTLSPDHGPPRTSVTVDGTGFTSCRPGPKSPPATAQLFWDNTPAGPAPLDANGRIHGFVDVPANAEPGPHLVVASCPIVRSPASPQPDAPAPGAPGLAATTTETVARDFVVDPDTPQTLALTPASGPVGRPFTARGTGFTCPADEPVVLRWEQRELGRVRPSDGNFELSVTVPADAVPGPHPVEASCGPAAERRATATFTVDRGGSVTPTPTPGPTPTPDPSDGPVLRVEPGAARPGQQVALTGTGFACRGAEAELTWNGVVWEHAGTGPGDGFVVTTRIADDARPGHYRLRAVCPDRPEMSGSTDFEVLSAHVVPDPGGGDAAPTALVVGSTAGGAAVLAALAGTYVLGRRRGPHWVSAHVAVAPVAGAPPRPLVTETDDPAGPGRTVRLESREDPGTQRVEETTGGGATGGGTTGGEVSGGEVSGGETGAEEGETTEEEP